MADKQPRLIEELLQLLAPQQKTMADHKFWNTQPVPALGEEVQSEGPIDRAKTAQDVPATPLPLLAGFEWATVDIDVPAQLDEVYRLLHDHYVEDQDATFRFKYSQAFFRWALQPPGWRRDWLVGVRVQGRGTLVAFVAAVPVTLKLAGPGATVPAVEINFLCVHKKLRSKRLAPVLIREITRRVNRHGVWHALYTAGVVLPSPVATCRYTHRPLDWAKLHDVGFLPLPPGQTKASMAARYTLAPAPRTPGFRPMEAADLDQVFDLLHAYQQRFQMVQVFGKAELAHWLLGGECGGAVVKAYVVERAGRICDFVSYYLLPFSVLDHAVHTELGVAYLFYYATDSHTAAPPVYQARLTGLVTDALITARAFGVDVFNALTCQDNTLFIDAAKFGPGDGLLHYYLFNYRAKPIDGGLDGRQQVGSAGSGVGVVLV
ncbi:N-myristoyl transferase [Metschnikowia bicuspidata var. bicuspidata NRRL YB-4993]|uniref:Glycylpeptide N-tetradecanoyltransferase n=1 Tax=Metschnikowia bicuspidata var. bicuspidata NRRL YB-4993 TaxID=869754 RepID=A0A1A0HJB3_9ASCO|nr:N-myristoyl transferase [Metschnikowia bicuspidata var. bicuspidata NRRL YB-4993]OBA24105.1 N-myristoyl transferase [Metschnikowia bicuspidata var. bicuspidata NRRL YB-4993]